METGEGGSVNNFPSNSESPSENSSTEIFILIIEDALQKMKVDELRVELTKRGISLKV